MSEIESLYLRWLKGESLRTLARGLPYSYGTLCSKFKRAYGDSATSPQAMSLQRSLLEDYPDRSDIDAWVLANLSNREPSTTYYGYHGLDMLSRYQVIHDPRLMDFIAVGEEPEYVVELRLPYLVDMLAYITDMLRVFVEFSSRSSR